MEHGRIQGLPKFVGYPLLSQQREKLRISNLVITFRGAIRTKKPIKDLGEKGTCAYPRTVHFLPVPPIISGTGKATDFKFGQYIQRVQPNKKKEKGVWAYPGTAQFFRVPLLSQERAKLRTSSFACTFIGSIGTKAH